MYIDVNLVYEKREVGVANISVELYSDALVSKL
jgi:hypothetical protein